MAKSCDTFSISGLFLDEYVIKQGNSCIFDKNDRTHTFITKKLENDIYLIDFCYNLEQSVRLYTIILNTYDKIYYTQNPIIFKYLLEIFDGIFMFSNTSAVNNDNYYNDLLDKYECIM